MGGELNTTTNLELVETLKGVLKSGYWAYAAAWKNEIDDRVIVTNTYNQLVQALKVMAQIDNVYIWNAFRQRFHESECQMQEIIRRYKNNQLN